LLGQVPNTGDADAMQDFVTNTTTQTINALIGRAFFSWFSPGAPSMPELYGQADADWAWRERGVETLDAEFRQLIARIGYDKALVVWAELHPDKLIMATGKTTTGAAGANFAVTLGSTQWVFDNKHLFEDSTYRKVAAYFVPPAPGEFNQTGWNAMTEIGVRQYKDTSSYYRQIVERNAVTQWFTEQDEYEEQRDALQAAGQEVAALDEQWRLRREELRAKYPILNGYFANSQLRAEDRRQRVEALKALVADESITKTAIPEIDGVVAMLNSHAQFQASADLLRGRRDQESSALKDQIRADYHKQLDAIVAKYPGLTDLYQGVFRWLEE
jgi:hypothetical protein